MKTKKIVFILSLLIISASIIIVSCHRDYEEEDNYDYKTPPTASFTVSPPTGTTSTTFSFDASGSSDNEDLTSFLQVRWDFENDSIWDVSYTTNKTASHQYLNNGTYIVLMEVKDQDGSIDSLRKTIKLGNTLVDNRDENVYYYVQIGNQTWMEENLAYLPSVSSSSDGSPFTPYYYVYRYNPSHTGDIVAVAKASSNYQVYGVLYNWPAAMNGDSTSSSNPSGVQGVCPTGWHLPSDAEWQELEMYLGMSQSDANSSGWRGTNEGSKLAGNASLWKDGDLENDSVFGTSGFIALPGGYRDNFSGFNYLSSDASFWSSTIDNSLESWQRSLLDVRAGVWRYNKSNALGYSVRCVKD